MVPDKAKYWLAVAFVSALTFVMALAYAYIEFAALWVTVAQ